MGMESDFTNNRIMNINFTLHEDEFCGYDVISELHGNLIARVFKSPLSELVKTKFNYAPLSDKDKVYKAVWTISQNQLCLGYVNGFINNKRLFTNDFLPDLADDEILHNYSYSGKLILKIKDENISKQLEQFKTDDDQLILNFEKGILKQ